MMTPKQTVLVAALVVAMLGAARGPTPVSAADSPAEPDQLELRPLTYDLDVTYDPSALEVGIRLELSLEILREPSLRDETVGQGSDQPAYHYQLALAPEFEVFAAAWDGREAPVYQGQGRKLIRLYTPGAEAGQKKRLALHYRGRPMAYDYLWGWQEYPSHATDDGIYVLSPVHWLPHPEQEMLPDSYWGGARVSLDVTVPGGWLVLVPGRAPPAAIAGDGQATFHYTGGPSAGLGDPTGPPLRWVAGPYYLAGGGTVRGLDCQAWGLVQGGRDLTGERLAQALIPTVDYAGSLVHPQPIAVPGGVLSAIQVPDGPLDELSLPADGAFLIRTNPGPLTTVLDRSWGTMELVWARAALRCLFPHLDEGMSEFLTLDFLRRSSPAEYAGPAEDLREMFAAYFDQPSTIGRGAPTDRSITAYATVWGDSQPTRERIVFGRVKPALVWNMFWGVFGDEAVAAVVRGSPTLPPVPGSPEWYSEVRRLVGEATGEAGLSFYDYWFTEAHRLDLAVTEARFEAVAPGRWQVTCLVSEQGGGDGPPAGGTVPWVEVALRYGDGPAYETGPATLVPLAERPATVMLECEERPLEVVLDPGVILLDYEPGNNRVRVRPTTGLGAWFPPPVPVVWGLILAGGLGALLFWRRLRRGRAAGRES